jgi:hypothetical protein
MLPLLRIKVGERSEGLKSSQITNAAPDVKASKNSVRNITIFRAIDFPWANDHYYAPERILAKVLAYVRKEKLLNAL